MASKPRNYWRNRMAQQQAWLLEEAHAYADQVERQYNLAIGSIQKDVDAWYRRLADNNSVSYAEAKKLLTTSQMEEFRWTVEEYIRYGQENAIDGQWAKQLENASVRVHISRLESLQIQMQQQVEVLFGNHLDGMDRAMRRTLTEGYSHTAFEIQRGIGVGWNVDGLAPKRLELLLKNPWQPDGLNFSERVWREHRPTLIRNLKKHLTQAIIRGDSPDRLIRTLAKEMNRAKSAAGRLVMTESAYFASVGQKECFKSLGVERYEIVATLDADTSELCQSLDGQVFPMGSYEPGVTAPPFHPWCRSATAPHFNDNFGMRAARDEEGKTYTVPGDMTYEEWKRKQAIGYDP